MAKRHWLGSRPKVVLQRLLLVLVLILVIRHWIWSPVFISGKSMLPTLHHGQLGAVNKLAYRFRPPQRGDIVVISTGKEIWVKRILGLPGEEIEVRQGTVYTNGKPLSEPYVEFKDDSDIEPGKLAANHFVVAGDNRQPALIAVVGRERIVGRWVPLWTPARARVGGSGAGTALERETVPFPSS
jgi:signal peptidase I